MQPIPITEAQALALIDAVFQAAESVTKPPIIKMIEQMGNTTIDALLPVLWLQLQAKGIVTLP